VFPVRYRLNFYILFRRNSVFQELMLCKEIIAVFFFYEDHTNHIRTVREQMQSLIVL
jgi:hypothetical protein